MLKAISTFVTELLGREEEDEVHFDDTDERLAAAALLFHAVAIDGSIEDVEREKLHVLLSDRFELSSSDTDTLIEEARERDLESVDLHGFTSVLNRALDEEGKQRIIEMLWEIVLSDGEIHEFEDNLVWRVAELLGVSTRDRMVLRKRVLERRAMTESSNSA